MSWPRLQLREIGDELWCPSWLHKHEMAALTQLWNFHIPGWSRQTLAKQACEVLRSHLTSLSSYTIVDVCAGAGGPTPMLESVLNSTLQAQGKEPASFILTDLCPYLEQWECISKRYANISYIKEPVDARVTRRFTPVASGRKECRIFNISFHHFDDKDAAAILRSAVKSADSFVIFEVTKRDVRTCLYSLLMIPWSCYTALLWFLTSPLNLFFTFVVPITPLAITIDGFISCLRTRTNPEIRALLDQPELDLSGWKFTSGERVVQWPFISLYYYVGVKAE